MFDVLFYFGPYAIQHSYADRNTEIADNMATYLGELEEDWTAYFYGPPSMYVTFPTIPFLATDYQADVNLFDVVEEGSELPPAQTDNQVFIFLPERLHELEALQMLYPNGRLQTFSGYDADPLFFSFEVDN